MERLVLFDIDATLLLTSGAGVAAMERAGRSLFGPEFSAVGVDFAGRLDPLLLQELMERNGVQATSDRHATYRREYLAELEAHSRRAVLGRVLPGVHELLARMRGAGEPMGLLTGNFGETGMIKLRSCGIDPAWFSPTVWGDASPHTPPKREDLAAVAVERASRSVGRELDGRVVTVVGDTPHDVRCAHAIGGRAVAVATGKYSIEQLSAAGADHVVSDLSDVERVFELLATTPRGA